LAAIRADAVGLVAELEREARAALAEVVAVRALRLLRTEPKQQPQA
jgi:hypothetical protein